MMIDTCADLEWVQKMLRQGLMQFVFTPILHQGVVVK
jgi:hypothetical protein